MPFFAPVAPSHMLKAMEKDNTLGYYHLLLAHDISAHYKEYRDVFHSRSWPGTVIMDNSVVELGSAQMFPVVEEATWITMANVVVLPDVLEKAAETVDAVLKSFQHWIQAFNHATWPIEFMVVPQGKTFKEWAWCAEQLRGVHYAISWWGIPRNLVKNVGTRDAAIRLAKVLNPSRKIHMLGFSDDIIQDVLDATGNRDIVHGIDSAVPLRMASDGIPFSVTHLMPPRGFWWETCTYTEDHKLNLERCRFMFQ